MPGVLPHAYRPGMRSPFAQRLGCSLGVLLLCLGTAAGAQEAEAPRAEEQEPEAPEQDEEQFLRVQTAKRDVSVRISPESAVGPSVQLVRDSGAVRGRAAGQSVYLRIEKGMGELDGLVGSQPAWISSASQKGSSLRLEGTFGGGTLKLGVSEKELSGTVGPCTYDLDFKDEAYQGVRVCDGERQHVWVFLTPGIPEQLSPMLATTLVVLLGT
jgi:hypothetical protein